jgi:hypothetical protein
MRAKNMINKKNQPTKVIRRFPLVPCPLSLSPIFVVNIGEDLKLQDNASIQDVAQFQSVGALISAWLPNIYILGGISVLILIIAAGLMWIGNAGDVKKIEEAQKILTFAIMGFIFLFASYWIIQIVQVLTGIPILNSTL